MPRTADFFELQERARRASLLLIPVYLLAMLAVAVAISVVFALIFAVWILFWGGPVADHVVLDYGHLFASYARIVVGGMPGHFYSRIAGVSLLAMACAAMRRAWQLRAGGEAVAELMGADPIEHASATPAEVRLLNVVEEMAIASGIVVPPVYVLRGERAINALAAGYGPNEAVIIATQGAIENLARDELQGVIGHEFSHILNGDMRLNVRLLGYLYGIVFVWQTGQELLRSATAGAIGVSREKQTIGVPQLGVGLVLTVIGWIGVLCARLIQAAISREREFLADAASAQFTRNPDGIAGALDTLLRLKVGTVVWCAHAEEVSHMYFGPGSVNELGPAFATHPPIEQRIRRVNPGFQRDRYRATRPRSIEQREVAVIDGVGNVVRTLSGGAANAAIPGVSADANIPLLASAIVASAGQPSREHVDLAARLIAAIPPAVRERLKSAEGATQLIFALALDHEQNARGADIAVIEARRGAEFARATAAAWLEAGTLSRAFRLPLAAMAVPVLRPMEQAERDRLVADLMAVAQADDRLTLSEFILIIFVKQRLHREAARPVTAQFRSMREVALDAQRILSLVAHASGGDTRTAFAKGSPLLDLGAMEAFPADQLSMAKLEESLNRLRLLAPLLQPRIIKACFEAAAADGIFRIAEVELVRTVAATLDCPLPPVLAAMDPEDLR